MKTLLVLAIVLALIATAGCAAYVVRDRMTAEHVFDKARALAEQRWHHENAMEAVRALVGAPRAEPSVQRVYENKKAGERPRHIQDEPKGIHPRSPFVTNGKRYPGDDSANELNRRELR